MGRLHAMPDPDLCSARLEEKNYPPRVAQDRPRSGMCRTKGGNTRRRRMTHWRFLRVALFHKDDVKPDLHKARSLSPLRYGIQII